MIRATEAPLTEAPRRPVRRRDPEDARGWGDVPPSALEHPFFRLAQVLLLVAALLFMGNRLGLLTTPEPTVNVTRVIGEDPIAAAVSAARQAYGGSVDTVIMVGVAALSDGVVATGLAGALDAPILLNEVERLSPQTRDVIRELGPSRVVLIGGANGIGPLVEQALAQDLGLEVDRLAGASRFDTADLVADAFRAAGDIGEIDDLPTAVMVPAEDVVASLAAGGLAAGRVAPMPVLLSQDGELPGPTQRALDRLGIEQLLAVAPAPPFDGSVITIEGVAETADAANLRGFHPPRVVVVPAGDDARALIAGPVAGRDSGVVLTFDVAAEWLAANCGTVNELFVIAEETVITDEDVDDMVDAALECPEED